MALLALMAMVVIPLEILILQNIAGRPLEMASGAVIRAVYDLNASAAGRRHGSAHIHAQAACPIAKPACLRRVLLPLAVLLLLAGAAPALLEAHWQQPRRHCHGRISGCRTRSRSRAGPARPRSPSSTRVVDRLPASSDRSVTSHPRILGKWTLRHHHPALRAARRNRRCALPRLAATAIANGAPAALMLLISTACNQALLGKVRK